MQYDDKIRYSRHLILPEIGDLGQQAICNSSILVIGAGGLGSPCLMYLAASGVGHLGIIDNDKVEKSNLQRQIIHDEQNIGIAKVNSASERIYDINSSCRVDCYDFRLDESIYEKKERLNVFANYDVIIDGSDNYKTRFLVNDLAVKFAKPLVSAAIFGFEAQFALYTPYKSPLHPCYRCLFAEAIPDDAIPNCSENGVFAPLAGTAGTIQADFALKQILNLTAEIEKKLFLYNSKKMTLRSVKFEKDDACEFCAAI